MCANTRVEVSHHLVERVLQFCLLRVFRADEEENSFASVGENSFLLLQTVFQTSYYPKQLQHFLFIIDPESSWRTSS